jgi:hypothetical protein
MATWLGYLVHIMFPLSIFCFTCYAHALFLSISLSISNYLIDHMHIIGHHMSHDKPLQHDIPLPISWYPVHHLHLHFPLFSTIQNHPDIPLTTPEGCANNIINDLNITSFLTHLIDLPFILMIKYQMDTSHICYHHTVTSHTQPSLIITMYFLLYMNPIPITHKRHSTSPCTIALALYSCTVNAVLEASLYSKLWVSTKYLCSWTNCYTPVTFVTTSSNHSNMTWLDHCPVQAVTSLKTASKANLTLNLYSLSYFLTWKCNWEVIVLIDGYEAPNNCAFDHGYFKEVHSLYLSMTIGVKDKYSRPMSFQVWCTPCSPEGDHD